MKNIEELAATKKDGATATYRKLSDVEIKPVSWLWPGRIARGKVSMIAGDPGLGKSQLMASIAALVTTGRCWPASSTPAPIGNVVFLSAEDDAGDTLRPRLEAAGADLLRVYTLDDIRLADDKGLRSFDLRQDLNKLAEVLRDIGGATLIVIDPITAYLGKTDDHKNGDIRALLHPLGELAARYDVAVMCISHLNKGGNGQKALMRVMGSVAFVAAARAAFAVVKDRENPEQRLFLPLKNNIGNDTKGLSFGIESHSLPGGIETSRVVWGEEVSIPADHALETGDGMSKKNAVVEAREFLLQLLSDGPIPAPQVKEEARNAEIAWTTVRRAGESLGVKSRRDGFGSGGKWVWELPSKMLPPPLDAQPERMNILEQDEQLKGEAIIDAQIAADEQLSELAQQKESVSEKIDRIERKMTAL